MKATVPIEDVGAYIKKYRARLEREYSNASRHVYYSRPMRQWIIVRRKGDQAEFEFTSECPCDSDD